MPYEAQKNPAAGASKDEAAIHDAVGGAAAQVADRNASQVDAAVGAPTEQVAIQHGIAATMEQQKKTEEVAAPKPADHAEGAAKGSADDHGYTPYTPKAADPAKAPADAAAKGPADDHAYTPYTPKEAAPPEAAPKGPADHAYDNHKYAGPTVHEDPAAKPAPAGGVADHAYDNHKYMPYAGPAAVDPAAAAKPAPAGGAADHTYDNHKYMPYAGPAAVDPAAAAAKPAAAEPAPVFHEDPAAKPAVEPAVEHEKTKAIDPHYKNETVDATSFRGSAAYNQNLLDSVAARKGQPLGPRINQVTTRYMAPAEQEKREVNFSGGKLATPTGAAMDTSAATGIGTVNGTGTGKHIFVMMPDGTMRAVDPWEAKGYRKDAGGGNTLGMVNHSSLAAGAEVAGAGEMTVKGGQLQQVSDLSGHYKPDGAMVKQTFDQLGTNGVDTGNVDVKLGAKTAGQKPVIASSREFMAEADPMTAETNMRDRRALLKSNIETAVAAFEARTGKNRTKSIDEVSKAAAPAIANPAAAKGAKDAGDPAKGDATPAPVTPAPKEAKPEEVAKDDEPVHADPTAQQPAPAHA